MTKMPHMKNTVRKPNKLYEKVQVEEPVKVPSLDLTSLTMDDEIDKAPKEPRKNYNNSNALKDNHVDGDAQKEDNNNYNGGKEVLFKRQMMPFVFPSEKSITDLGNSHQHQPPHDEQYYITSVSSYRTNSMVNDSCQGKEPVGLQCEDGTISFSLSNLKNGNYILDSNNSTKAEKKETTSDLLLQADKQNKLAKSVAFSSGSKPRSAEESGTPGQQIYDVIVVNGHFKSSESDEHDNPEIEKSSLVDSKLEEQALQAKPTKARVTFSFDDNGAPSGRYTPIKPDVRVQLQSVLKKRKTPSPVLQRSYSEDRISRRHRHSPVPNRDSIRLFGSSYTLDYRFGCHTTGLEYGIPVKHVHTTNMDLENNHNIHQSMKTNNTNMGDKPPTGANRITLSMAEKVATSGSVRGMPSRGNRLSTSHTRGRMAFFRPSERGRSTNTSSHHSRSKSSEDVQCSQSRSSQSFTSTSTTKSGKSQQGGMPFSLRRCASSERDLVMTTIDDGSKHQQRRKPKVAFGSFILPKESASRIKPAHVQFHELNAGSAVGRSSLSAGSYVHSHTRRSPYAAPTQVLLTDHRTMTEVARRPSTGLVQTRPLSQQQQQQPQHQQMVANKSHAQRHSAPSSYSQGQSREKNSTTPQYNNSRISVNTSPTKARFPKSTDEITYPVSSNHPHSHGAYSSTGVSAADKASHRQRTIADLNAIANKERGTSHHRFISKLESFTKDGL